MKKYAALLLIVAGFAALAWASVLTIRMAVRPALMLPPSSPVSLHTTEGEAELQRLRRIDQVLTKMADLKPLASQMATGPLAQTVPVALATLSQSAAQPRKSGPAVTITESPVISMVYLSSNMQRAVINGKTYATGDRMPGGAHLLSISLNEVVLDDNGKRKVLPVPRSQVSGSTSSPVDAK